MSAFRCQTCSAVVNIPTRKWKRRKRGHVKSMWCWRCKKDRLHDLL